MKRVVRWMGAVILAAAVLTMVLADIVLSAPAGDARAGWSMSQIEDTNPVHKG